MSQRIEGMRVGCFNPFILYCLTSVPEFSTEYRIDRKFYALTYHPEILKTLYDAVKRLRHSQRGPIIKRH